jgi:hypothetical protein
MEATAFTDRSNRKEKACKKEESIYGVERPARLFAQVRSNAGLALFIVNVLLQTWKIDTAHIVRSSRECHV